MNNDSLPVAVIGAGPVGLAAAAHLVERGETPLVFEASDGVGGTIRDWAHVPMFSPWEYTVDQASVALLEATGWQMPPLRQLPTGGDLIEHYLDPLAATAALKPYIHFNARVTAISRRRIDKMKDTGREQAPFVIQVDMAGKAQRFLARAVIDASGTWHTPNPLGADGLAAVGEIDHRDQIFYGIPDIPGQDGARYRDKCVAVIGGGHSAINAILELGDLQQVHPETEIHWILRKAAVNDAYGGLEADALPGRGLLGIRIKEMVGAGRIHVHTPVYVQEIDKQLHQLIIRGDTLDGQTAILVDEIIAATGARPDLSFLSELRITLDPAVESTPALAPLIDPNIHSCGTVRPHGEAELRQPEQGFYIVGMKSYGRAPTFLLATGYEQVRSVVAALVGDWEAAAQVQLNLPESGVCGVNLVDANSASEAAACCEPVCCTPEAPASSAEEACCEPGCCDDAESTQEDELVLAAG